MGVAATAKINRRDFDINGGTVAVGDEVQVTLDIELIGSPSPPKSTQLK
jgi:polyisoprenoid-binding protein YceI